MGKCIGMSTVTKENIARILRRFGIIYVVRDLSLFRKALTHMSYFSFLKGAECDDASLNGVIPELECYDRLEFLGDSVIKLVLSSYIFNRYPSGDSGMMTKLRTKLERGETLTRLGKELGLDKLIMIDRELSSSIGGQIHSSVMEDAFEAFIGALYADNLFNDKYARELVINLIESKIDVVGCLKNDDNFKSQLMEYYHKLKWPHPVYHVTNTWQQGTSKSSRFSVSVRDIKGETIGEGIGTSKKRAEQFAAKEALEYLGVIRGESPTEEEEEEILDADSDYDLSS